MKQLKKDIKDIKDRTEMLKGQMKEAKKQIFLSL